MNSILLSFFVCSLSKSLPILDEKETAIFLYEKFFWTCLCTFKLTDNISICLRNTYQKIFNPWQKSCDLIRKCIDTWSNFKLDELPPLLLCIYLKTLSSFLSKSFSYNKNTWFKCKACYQKWTLICFINWIFLSVLILREVLPFRFVTYKKEKCNVFHF